LFSGFLDRSLRLLLHGGGLYRICAGFGEGLLDLPTGLIPLRGRLDGNLAGFGGRSLGLLTGLGHSPLGLAANLLDSPLRL
jgi:hypothetical protein